MSTETMPASPIAQRYLRCHLADGVGPVLLARIIKRFGSLEAALSASPAELQHVDAVGPRRAQAFFDARHSDEIERELDRAAQIGVRIICWEDPDYPAQLRHCNDPPVCLYVRGTLQPQDAVALAIVGSRKCTHYGMEQARRFAALLAGAGFTVISGLARGIDGHAHEGALAARGRTLAVLGNGVDTVYPPEHRDLAERVMRSGCILAEDPLGSSPSADSFPRRNRIIAGLSLGVIVVEASKRSGALITARLASEYNREVFAVPGRVDSPTSVGTNDLIRRSAAKLVASLEDVTDELGDVGKLMIAPASPSLPASAEDTVNTAVATPAEAVLATLSDAERTVIESLGQDEHYVDQIIEATNLPAAVVAGSLTTLQLKGLIIALPGNRYARRRS